MAPNRVDSFAVDFIASALVVITLLKKARLGSHCKRVHCRVRLHTAPFVGLEGVRAIAPLHHRLVVAAAADSVSQLIG